MLHYLVYIYTYLHTWLWLKYVSNIQLILDKYEYLSKPVMHFSSIDALITQPD